MTLHSVRRTAAAAVVGLTLTALTGCSTGSTSADDGDAVSEGSADAEAFPVTIEHALGETTIEEEPERVVAMGYGEADAVLSLGVVPVASTKITYGGNESGSTDWFDAALAEIDGAEQPERLDETDGLPVDDIIALEPDVVLATSGGITQQEYDKVTKAGIPVVAYPEAPYVTTWQETLEMDGRALGRSDLAGEVEEETEQVIADTAEKFPQLEGTSFVFGGPNDADLSSFYVYTPQDNRPRLLVELGMQNTPFVEEKSEDGQFLFSISSERASELDADVFLTYAETEDQVSELAANPLLRQIPAIEDNRWYATVDETEALGLSAPSPLSIPDGMKRYIPGVAAAVDGDGSSS